MYIIFHGCASGFFVFFLETSLFSWAFPFRNFLVIMPSEISFYICYGHVMCGFLKHFCRLCRLDPHLGLIFGHAFQLTHYWIKIIFRFNFALKKLYSPFLCFVSFSLRYFFFLISGKQLQLLPRFGRFMILSLFIFIN